MSKVSNDYYCQRLAKIEARIEILEDAIDDISSDGIVRYSFDSGQTNQSVEKMSLKDANTVLDSLYARRETFNNLCKGTGSSFNAGPEW
ncbi:coil containing protein [Vibrio phage 1.086.O._10N.222.51.F8]|nr:coil containing protein [Vibrio phage 1.086.O._10N.222.51.F8]